MSAENEIYLLKVRVAVDGGLIGVLGLEINVEKRMVIRNFSVAGIHETFQTFEIGMSYDDFDKWVVETRYYGNFEQLITMDLEQFGNRIAKNMVIVERLSEAIKKGDSNQIEFFFRTDLEHILNDKNIALEVQADVKLAKIFSKDADEAAISIDPGLMKLEFILAPVNGVSLARLNINQMIYVKFKDKRDPRTIHYLQNNEPADPRYPDRAIGILRKLSSVKDTGEIQALVDLPGNNKGEIIEESSFVRVKVYEDVVTRKRVKEEAAPINMGTIIMISGVIAFALGIFFSVMIMLL